MDPVSALGVASSIVQLVDFGFRLVSNSVELYKSNDGATVTNRDLAITAQDLPNAKRRFGRWEHLDQLTTRG